jgi:hypothetical protein
MPRPQRLSLRALPAAIALALLLLLPACAPRLKTAAWVVRFDLDNPAKVAAVCSEARLAESVELGGIFRYANPKDSPDRWQKQEALCEKARQRLLNGEDLATVAKEMSQDGTRTMGGLLAPRFLDPLNPQDQELARLALQGISQVTRVANGFWCYRLEGRSTGTKSTFAEAPWEAKRILFRRALGEMMKDEAESGR